ncbi:hyaluronidase-4 [Eucyclogobius newberryi]|uniref:hyaluronidase-4 n=1 Tax=Eucyclogobius newberryi TaxID=166745 RepID=UPI003B5B7842
MNNETPVNGGLPQHTKLDLHIQKTQGDVETALPAPRYLGLGVVRWQEWSPQWSRSGDKQGLGQNATRKLLRRFFPDWTEQELERWSKVDFEAAAQSVMTETLREVQRSRPKALWGMCPYPSCSNGSPAQTALSDYTGECPEEERSLNDQLLWLWRRSNAIYPLLTMEKIQSGTRGATLFLSNQIREALRVASLGGSSDDLPVFPLVRSVYASTNTFLSLSDLVTTIGESAALGTAGIVIWDKTEAKTERECEELSRFTSSALGPYVSNVTAASRLCSASLCQNRGRCVRLDQDKPTFLHLPPNSQDAADTSDEATDQPDPFPRPDPDPAELWKRDFQCQWFSSADRDVSDQQSPKDGSPSVGKREDSVGRGLDALATVSDGISTTTGAYKGQNGEKGGPKTTLETPLDRGAIKSPPKTMALLLLLLALYLWT